MAIKSCFRHCKIENGTIIHFGRVCVSCLIHAIATRVYAKIAKKEYVSYAWKSSQVGPLQGLGCAFFLFVFSISEFCCHAVTRFPLKCFVSTRGWACESYVTYSQDAWMWFLTYCLLLLYWIKSLRHFVFIFLLSVVIWELVAIYVSVFAYERAHVLLFVFCFLQCILFLWCFLPPPSLHDLSQAVPRCRDVEWARANRGAC